MSRTLKWAVGAISIAVLAGLPASAPAVFPGENGRIAYVSGAGGPPNDDSSADVYILDGPGDLTAAKLTTAAGQHRHPAWSPQLDEVAYARHAGAADHDLFLHPLGGTPNVVGGFSPAITEDRPSYSPDGTKIAYEREVVIDATDSELDIMIFDLETNTETNLTKTTSFDEGKPVWTPDGETIYYSKGVSPVSPTAFNPFDDILARPADGGTETAILVGGTEDYQPALSPDGSRLCFTRGAFGTANADVYTVAANGSGTPVDLSQTAAGGYNCAWSPDGRFIAWVLGTFTSGELVFERSDNSQATPNELAPNVPNHFDGNPDWAPRDPAFCQGQPATIAGTRENDNLTGTGAGETIVAHAGDDTANGAAGDDLVCGSEGDDTVEGDDDNDRVFGEDGKDAVTGGLGNDELSGDAGNDRVKGNGGADKANGGGGKDKVKGNDGKDKLKGSGGRDKVIGGNGKDKLKGGGGKDKLKSADNKRDKVNCGGGKDKATVDKKDKVKKNCENVKVI